LVDLVQIKKIDETYIKVYCEPGIAFELRDEFKFQVPGYKFMPAYKNKFWDGFIYLFNPMNCTIYTGLYDKVVNFCRERNYEVELLSDFSNSVFSVKEAKEFISSISLNPKYELRDYQLKTFIDGVRKNRQLFLSPTASGKSLMIYLLTRYYLENTTGKTLIIVPTTQLVLQMTNDFIEYGYSGEDVHIIMSGKEKTTDKRVIVSTWQSIYKMSNEWFSQFTCVFGDEAHLAKAKSLTTIMNKMVDCQYRFGFTGTLDGTQCNEMILNGLFGTTTQVTTSIDLMAEKSISNLNIKILNLKYPDDIRKSAKVLDYRGEVDFLVNSSKRNNFIKNLALSLEGNTIVLYQYVEKHGKVLHQLISDEAKDRNVYFISGEIDGEDREVIRKIIETEINAIIVASMGTFSTGTNMKNLKNLIFAFPSKGKIRVLQSIGRVLRLHQDKIEAILYDIADDLSWKNHKNYTSIHLIERIKIYIQESFKYKIYDISLG
jgi:superfamily II DNA or RNA helicase